MMFSATNSQFLAGVTVKTQLKLVSQLLSNLSSSRRLSPMRGFVFQINGAKGTRRRYKRTSTVQLLSTFTGPNCSTMSLETIISPPHAQRKIYAQVSFPGGKALRLEQGFSPPDTPPLVAGCQPQHLCQLHSQHQPSPVPNAAARLQRLSATNLLHTDHRCPAKPTLSNPEVTD